MYFFDIKKGREKTDRYSEKFLEITCAGVAIGSYQRFKGDCRIYRAEGRDDWQIQLVTEGVIDLYDGDTHYLLKPGDCFIIPPHVTNDYIYRVKNRKGQSVGNYVHFSGTAAKEVMDRIGVDSITVLRGISENVIRIYESMLFAFRLRDELTALGYLLRFVSALSGDRRFALSDTDKAVRLAAEHINKHYTEEIDYEALAVKCNLSRSRFTHVFSNIFGVSPTQYQQNMKVEQAIELLQFSKLSVSEIAHRCGFRDPLYFSRVFRKVKGVSPTEYRNTK